MRKMFLPFLALALFVGARHVVMTAWLVNRSVRRDLAQTIKQTESEERAVYLEKVVKSLESYHRQLRFFRFTDPRPNTQTLERVYPAVKKMLQDSKYSSDPTRVAQTITAEIRAAGNVSLGVLDDQQRMVSTLLFWLFAVLAMVAGALYTFSPPE